MDPSPSDSTSQNIALPTGIPDISLPAMLGEHDLVDDSMNVDGNEDGMVGIGIDLEGDRSPAKKRKRNR
jgi:hypothetical protein